MFVHRAQVPAELHGNILHVPSLHRFWNLGYAILESQILLILEDRANLRKLTEFLSFPNRKRTQIIWMLEQFQTTLLLLFCFSFQ